MGSEYKVSFEDPKNDDNDFEFEFPFLACCIAKRGSGKTFLTKYLVHHWWTTKQVDLVIAFSNTTAVNNEYEYLDKRYVIQRYDDKKLKEIMVKQAEQIKKTGKDSPKVKKILIILDDVIGSFEQNSTTVRELITQGRHYNISLILNIQISKKEFSPEFRKNADYFIIGYNNKSVFKQLGEELEFDGTEKAFNSFLQANTTDFNFVIYINKVMETYNVEQRYKIIKAEDSEELKNFHIK